VEQAVLKHRSARCRRASACAVPRGGWGHWWRRVPLWLLVLDEELYCLAAGRRRFVGRIPLFEARKSLYDHQKESW